MTTLAIIGGGIAGRSLLFTLAKEGSNYSQILFFESPVFAPACSHHSTAIVAPRGVSAGHSTLGDLLLAGFTSFDEHVKTDSPAGVFPIHQYTGAHTKLENFKKRYPGGSLEAQAGPVSLRAPLYLAQERGYLIDPDIYLNWLIQQAREQLTLEHISDLVSEVIRGDSVVIKTHNGSHYQADALIFATGAYTSWWKSLLPANRQLGSSKVVPGAYLEFGGEDWGSDSFALTLEGDNLIYRAHSQTLLVGSTTQSLQLPDKTALEQIHARLQLQIDRPLPDFATARVRLGLREKVSRREPYLVVDKNIYWLGGFYKNGFSLGLKMARSLVSHLRP